MNKKKAALLFNIISICLVIAFIVISITDYFQYSPLFNSAPFYAVVIGNGAYLLFPAFVAFAIGDALKKK